MMGKRYKKMLAGMQAKEKRSRKKQREKWFLYILECSDHSLYTGIAKDVAKRFQMHLDGKGARYTRIRKPVEVVYQELCRSRTKALVRECAVKAMPKPRKLDLIEQFHRTKSGER